MACRSFRPSLSPRVPRSWRVSAAFAELFDLTRAWMASSSVGRGAASAPPPPDRLAVFYKLVDKKVVADVLCRDARAVELAAEAAAQAEALFPNDSLVVARLRMHGSESLSNIASQANGAEKSAFLRQSRGRCSFLQLPSSCAGSSPTRCCLAPSGRRSWTTMLTSRLQVSGQRTNRFLPLLCFAPGRL